MTQLDLDQAWRIDAACKPGFLDLPLHKQRQVCDDCPVRLDCLLDDLAGDYLYGERVHIRGGHAGNPRQEALKRAGYNPLDAFAQLEGWRIPSMVAA